MSVIRRVTISIVGLALVAAPALARAQSTEEQLKKAIDLYNNFAIEQARPLLLQIVSPNNPFPVTTEQKVRAYKYLGASYAVLDRRDSAVVYLSAAIDYDPFMDLDPREFSAAELAAFSEARSRIFKVAIRPIQSRILDSNFVFNLITTQRANLLVEIVKQGPDSLPKEVLFPSNMSDGLRDIRWDGHLRSGARADSTLFEIRATARSASGTTIEGRQLFRIEHVFEPLEDTLPTIPASDLLPAQYEATAPWYDLAKGAAMAIAAVALPVVTLGSDMKWQGHAAIGAVAGLAGGFGSFAYRRTHRSIPQNVNENARRQQQRAVFNSGVRARNADRLNRTIMLICPPTGCPR